MESTNPLSVYRLGHNPEMREVPNQSIHPISQLGDRYDRRKGPSRVEGKMRLFDEDEFPAVGPGNGMVNVLVVGWDCEVAERVTVAQIHVQAREEAGPTRKHIRLA